MHRAINATMKSQPQENEVWSLNCNMNAVPAFSALKNLSDSPATLCNGWWDVMASDNYQSNDRAESIARTDEASARCSADAWRSLDRQSRLDRPQAEINSQTGAESNLLDFAQNDPLQVAQEPSQPHDKSHDEISRETADAESAETDDKAENAKEHRYYQSIYIHLGDRMHGMRGKFDDPGHVAVQVEDTGSGYKSNIVGLGPDGSVLLNPIRTKGSIHPDNDHLFEKQVRREISKENYDLLRKQVNEEHDKGNIGYSLLFPKQCTTEAIKLSSFAGWAIETQKEKIAPFFPAQVTPNTLYETFSNPQPLDLINLDKNGKPRLIEIIDLTPQSNEIDHDAFED